jgi:LmbE family N-acetylglucosaminyl deacetylase
VPHKVLVLTPHPDDAEFFAGGTLAKMAIAGAEVTIIIATNGNKGSFELGAVELAEVRRIEALRAAAVLGVKEVVFLEHEDGALDRLDPGHLREQFMRAIRERQPDILITFDPFAPFEDHPDHRAVGFAALEAVNFASYPLYHPEHLDAGLEPHQVNERYFFAKNPTYANKAIDISETLDAKIAAILEHKSQVRFLSEDWMQRTGAAGASVAAILSQVGEENEGSAQGMAWMIRQQARADGAAVGLEFAERFRYPSTIDQRPMTKREGER